MANVATVEQQDTLYSRHASLFEYRLCYIHISAQRAFSFTDLIKPLMRHKSCWAIISVIVRGSTDARSLYVKIVPWVQIFVRFQPNMGKTIYVMKPQHKQGAIKTGVKVENWKKKKGSKEEDRGDKKVKHKAEELPIFNLMILTPFLPLNFTFTSSTVVLFSGQHGKRCFAAFLHFSRWLCCKFFHPRFFKSMKMFSWDRIQFYATQQYKGQKQVEKKVTRCH